MNWFLLDSKLSSFQHAVGLSTFQKVCSVACGTPRWIFCKRFHWRQAWLSHRSAVPKGYLKVSHSELKTQFSPQERSAMVTFSGLPTKAFYSMMYLKESVYMCWDKNGIIWDRTSFPPSLGTMLFICHGGSHLSFSDKKRKHISFWGEQTPGIAFRRVNFFTGQDVLLFKGTAQYLWN